MTGGPWTVVLHLVVTDRGFAPSSSFLNEAAGRLYPAIVFTVPRCLPSPRPCQPASLNSSTTSLQTRVDSARCWTALIITQAFHNAVQFISR